MKQNRQRHSVEVIISAVSDVFAISKKDIFRKTRKKEIAEARQVVAYYLRLINKMSFPAIGRVFDGMDHTTAIYSFKKVISKMERDTGFYALVQRVFDKIENRPEIKEEESIIDSKEKLEQKKTGATEKEKPKITIKNFEISDREKDIMAKYRQGITLQKIADDFGITRERVRQIVFKVNLKEIGAKTKDGFEIDIEEFIRAEKMVHTLARKGESKEDMVAEIIVGPKRWSQYYIKCRGCGTIKIPHARKGYCKQCVGETRRAILENDSICASCGTDRSSAKIRYGRDLYVTKEVKILCRRCFTQFTGRKMGERNRRSAG